MSTIDEIKKLQHDYSRRLERAPCKLLITGETGTGKTYNLRTAPTPLHVDSFDPGGSNSISDMVDKGLVAIDAKYEGEDPDNPRAFHNWMAMFDFRLKTGYFKPFATYVLDSSTWWNASIMGYLLAKNKKELGTSPSWRDGEYSSQRLLIEGYVQKILSMSSTLGINVIVTGHLDEIYTMRMVGNQREKVFEKYRYLTVGKSRVFLPAMFDAVIVSCKEKKGGKNEYFYRVNESGEYLARIRTTRVDKLRDKEPQAIANLMKKCGYSGASKPSLLEYIASQEREAQEKE